MREIAYNESGMDMLWIPKTQVTGCISLVAYSREPENLKDECMSSFLEMNGEQDSADEKEESDEKRFGLDNMAISEHFPLAILCLENSPGLWGLESGKEVPF